MTTQMLVLLLLSVTTEGAATTSDKRCCHVLCPVDAPTAGSDCTVSVEYSAENPCEYDEYCKKCDVGGDLCLNITRASCDANGIQGTWAVSMVGMEPCPLCKPNPNGFCLAYLDPVCGSDGKTYSNKCEAKAACQYEGSTRGACTSCPKKAPSPGDKCYPGTAFDRCEYDEYCQTCDGPPKGIMPGEWEREVCLNTTIAECIPGTGGLSDPFPPSPPPSAPPVEGAWRIHALAIEPCPCKPNPTPKCPKELIPVCGLDGKTYRNSCLAMTECQYDGSAPPGPCCTPNLNAVCTEQWDPLCGSDGKTYSNKCEAKAACQLDSTPGKCTCKPKPNPACSKEKVPVCGANGITYGNQCLAEAACQFDSTPGTCCKDKKKKCKVKKCKKRKMFQKKCQATCAAHCLEDPEEKKKCPKDEEDKRCTDKKKLDCTDKKTKKKCPLSCLRACVLPKPPCVCVRAPCDC